MLAAAVALTTVGLIAPPTARAEVVVVEGPIPAEALAGFAACPPADAFVTQNPQFCLKVRAYDGEVKIGDTIAAVDGPIEMMVGIGWGSDPEGNLLAEVVPAQGDGSGGDGMAPITMSGGLLGVPELDALLELDTGGLLSEVLGVSASPQLGTVGVAVAEGQDPVSAALKLLSWLSGVNQDVGIEFPLAIKVNNLLFGNKCQIPEFTVNLTTGTTAPPEGVAPMVGDYGEPVTTSWDDADIVERRGARLVDNTFSIDGAGQCDLLVGDVLDQPVGLFDSVISGQVGLPSPAGNNHATFTLDTEFISYFDGLLQVRGGPVDFGEVAVGSSVVQTVTVRSTGTHAATVGVGTSRIAGIGYSIVESRCDGLVLEPGDECEVDISFSPALARRWNARLEVRTPTSFVLGRIELTGLGVNP